MHGNEDQIVPLGQSELLVKALRTVHTPVDFMVISGGGHSGDIFFTHEKLEKVRMFFDRYLKDGAKRLRPPAYSAGLSICNVGRPNVLQSQAAAQAGWDDGKADRHSHHGSRRPRSRH